MDLVKRTGIQADRFVEQLEKQVHNEQIKQSERESNFVDLAKEFGQFPCLSQRVILDLFNRSRPDCSSFEQDIMQCLKVISRYGHLKYIEPYHDTPLSERLINKVIESKDSFYEATRIAYAFIGACNSYGLDGRDQLMADRLSDLSKLARSGNARSQYCYATCIRHLSQEDLQRLSINVIASEINNRAVEQNYPPALYALSLYLSDDVNLSEVMGALGESLRLGCMKSLEKLTEKAMGLTQMVPDDRVRILNLAMMHGIGNQEDLSRGLKDLYEKYNMSEPVFNLSKFEGIALEPFSKLTDSLGLTLYKPFFKIALSCLNKEGNMLRPWAEYSINENLAAYEICFKAISEVKLEGVDIDRVFETSEPISIDDINTLMKNLLVDFNKSMELVPFNLEEIKSYCDSMLPLIAKARFFYSSQCNPHYEVGLLKERQGEFSAAAEAFALAASLGCSASLIYLSNLLIDQKLDISDEVLGRFIFGELKISDARAMIFHLAIRHSSGDSSRFKNALGLELINAQVHESIWLGYSYGLEHYSPSVIAAYLFNSAYREGYSEGLVNFIRLAFNDGTDKIKDLIMSHAPNGASDINVAADFILDTALRKCNHTANMLVCCAVFAGQGSSEMNKNEELDAWKQYHPESRMLSAVCMLDVAVEMGSSAAYIIFAFLCQEKKGENLEWWKKYSDGGMDEAAYDFIKMGAKSGNKYCIEIMKDPDVNHEAKVLNEGSLGGLTGRRPLIF